MNSKTDDIVSTKTKMQELLKNSPKISIPQLGSLVEGKVINKVKNKVLVDIDGINTGIIAGREAHDSTETFKDLAEGSIVQAVVIDNDNDEGLIVLSLRKASQEKTWGRFIDAYENKTPIEVTPNEANKGGLLLEIDGIKGFIPVSQLAPLHYPRVNGADANLILQKLKKLIGVALQVKIINLDRENGKLILSERAAFQEERQKALKSLGVGNVVEGKISGVVKFGIFVAFDGLEGLVHISEIAWGHVSNPADHGKVGDAVKVQIIGIEGDKISLSIKRLTEDPWKDIARQFELGRTIKGEINRLAPFGAFMKLTDDINGLIHLSEMIKEDGTPAEDPSDVLHVGQQVEARVIDVNLDEHRIGLSLKPATASSEEPVTPKKASKKKVAEEEEAVEEEA